MKSARLPFALSDSQELFLREYEIEQSVMLACDRSGFSFVESVPDCYYTYFIADPRDGKIIYVGKGKGKRVKAHARNVANGVVDNPDKFERIASVIRAGLEPLELIFSMHKSESVAYYAEGKLIDRLLRFGITNGGVRSAENGRKKVAAFAKRTIESGRLQGQLAIALDRIVSDRGSYSPDGKMLPEAIVALGSALSCYDSIMSTFLFAASCDQPKTGA